MRAATIGSALAEKRHELGLEKGRAAAKIGMSRTTYSSYEQDAQRPSVDVFPALASFLDISIEELLTLYGATCVAALRASLKQLTANLPDGRVEEESPEEPPTVIAFPDRNEPEAPIEALSVSPEGLEATETVATTPRVLELVETEEPTERDEVREEQTVTFEPQDRTEFLESVGAPDIAQSHLIEKTPRSVSGEKSSGHKKKKKKKQKKNS